MRRKRRLNEGDAHYKPNDELTIDSYQSILTSRAIVYLLVLVSLCREACKVFRLAGEQICQFQREKRV